MTNATAVEAMVERLEPENKDTKATEVQVFKYLGASGEAVIRCVVGENGEPWFVAADVCKALELTNTAMALTGLEGDERGLKSFDTPGGNQSMTVITEAGLYSLILRSRKPEAKTFKRCVTHDVIPSIRKHGAYMTPAVLEKVILNPSFVISLCERIKSEQEKNAVLTEIIKQGAPKVQYHDAVTASAQEITVADLAALLKKNGVEIGRDRLFAWMRKNKFLCSRGSDRNRPSYVSQVMGILTCHNTFAADGTPRLQPLVTPKGQTYFLRCFGIITAPLTWNEDQGRRKIEEDRCRWWAKKRIGDTEKLMCAFEKGTLGEWEELDKILRVGTLTGKYADELVEERDF